MAYLAINAAVGSTSGVVEVWDPRDKQRAGILDVRGTAEQRQAAEVSALRYHSGVWHCTTSLGGGMGLRHILGCMSGNKSPWRW